MFVLFLTNRTIAKSISPIANQLPLRPALPCIYGPLEYRVEREIYERIDDLLLTTGIEAQ